MNQDGRFGFSKGLGNNRSRSVSFRKKAALVAASATLALVLMGCTLDDLLTPFGSGDIPFEQEQTTPTDIGAVDNSPTVPDDDSFIDADDLQF